jgi:hypothetical protein
MTGLAVSLVLLLSALPVSQSGSPRPKGTASDNTTEVVTDHLRIRYVHEVAAGPGGAIALAVDIAPRPRMHVYAPGADEYQVISMTISQPSGIQARPMAYPPSEIYFFEPLKERIPVYQKPFRLTLDARLDVSKPAKPAGTSLKVNGRLDYQACDDKVCFAPVSVPLSWTVVQ